MKNPPKSTGAPIAKHRPANLAWVHFHSCSLAPVLFLAIDDIRESQGFQKRIVGGLAAFGILAAFGLRFLYKGLRNDIHDWIGERYAPRWSYILFGLLCQLPLAGFILLLSHQGYFAR
jgi:hypothetical protein